MQVEIHSPIAICLIHTPTLGLNIGSGYVNWLCAYSGFDTPRGGYAIFQYRTRRLRPDWENTMEVWAWWVAGAEGIEASVLAGDDRGFA